MKLILAIFISLNLFLIQLTYAFETQTLFSSLKAQPISQKLKFPLQIRNLNEFKENILSLPDTKQRALVIQDLNKLDNSLFPIEITKIGNKISIKKLVIDVSQNTIIVDGHSLNFDPKNIDYELIKSFLIKHYTHDGLSNHIINFILAPANANPLWIVTIAALTFFYISTMSYLLENPVCDTQVKRLSGDLLAKLNTCNNDLDLLEQGQSKNLLATTSFSRSLSLLENANIANRSAQLQNCEKFIEDQIKPCETNDTTKNNIELMCKNIKKLSSCLVEFNNFDPESLNSSSRNSIDDNTSGVSSSVDDSESSNGRER